MKNSRKKRIAGYLLVCVLTMAIGFFLSLQIKTTIITGNYAGGMVSLAQAQVSTAELNKVKSEKEELLKELNELEEKVKKYESEATDDNAVLKEKLADIEKFKMASGMTDVKGPGLIVTIDDPASDPAVNSESVITYNYQLILVLVNKMRESGAEAISINGQRITAYTEISLAGNNININGVPTAPPYEVKAIGDAATMESTLSIRYGIIYSMKNDYNLKISLSSEDEIEIPRYTGVMSFDYAKTVE